MAGVTFPVLAPAPNIIRRTTGQAEFLPALLRIADGLRTFSSAPPERLDAMMGPAFSALSRALLHAPHYHDLFIRSGFGPGDLTGPSDLPNLPVLSRNVLLEDPFRLVRQDEGAEERDGLVALRSSGSSGQPVTVYKSRLECLVMWGVLRYWLERLGIGIPPRPRSVLLCTLPSGLEYSVRIPVLASGALHRISTQRARTLERLRKVRPLFVFTNPDGLRWYESQPAPPVPRLFLSSAQYLSPEIRSSVLTRFGTPVINYYASTETGPIAWECLGAAGKFHVLIPDVWVESQEGELLVTRLRPSPFLLLRYRIGDRGRVHRDECECGYRGLSISDFGGRCQTRFVAPNGESIDPWKLAYLFKYLPLRSFHLAQTGREEFSLEIVSGRPEKEFDGLLGDLSDGLRRLGFPDPRVTLSIRGGDPDTRSKFDAFSRR